MKKEISKNQDKILKCFYEIHIKSYNNENIKTQHNNFMTLRHEIPDFEILLNDLRAKNFVLYKHNPENGREENLCNPLTDE